MRSRPPLPSVRPQGLELAGYDGGGAIGLAGLQDEVLAYVQTKFDTLVAPRIQAEAAKGAEAAVRPLVMGSLAVSAVAVILSIAAILKR